MATPARLFITATFRISGRTKAEGGSGAEAQHLQSISRRVQGSGGAAQYCSLFRASVPRPPPFGRASRIMGIARLGMTT